MKVTAVFDIGKTNKKFFLFDENYQEVFREYVCFEEIMDDDGFPADDLMALQRWVKTTFNKISQDHNYQVSALNFSAYGASFVHIGADGEPIAPLYNYTKSYPNDILQSFYSKYGTELKIAKETASPPLGMLNSGLQLYWLKYTKPDIFNKIRWSLHLPQYLSYLFTGVAVSDYTSIGCHTMLWNYKKNDYHQWVYAEKINQILPPIVKTGQVYDVNFDNKKIKTGVGIHDSSAALLPYLRSNKEPFLLISTGTWSISLNPFSEKILTEEELMLDCLNYLRTDGKPVKAARLFLGDEYNLQVKKLNVFYQKDTDYCKSIQFDESIYRNLLLGIKNYFKFERILLSRAQLEITDLSKFENFETAYHQLIMELVALQVQSANLAIGNTLIKKVYIDGGFADNDIYIKLLAKYFNDYKLIVTQSPLGSALGAALVLSESS